MALGGGNWTSQNKVLPGTYINFVSASSSSELVSDRGFCTVPFSFDWGPEGEVIEINSSDFPKNAFKLFGYDYDSDNLKNVREVLKNANVLYAYRLNGGGTKASNSFCTAKYGGTRGNALKTVIAVNVDDNTKYDVSTYLGTVKVDSQTVASAAGLVDNDFVTFNTSATLSATTGTSLTSGTNASVTSTSYSNYFDALESYSYNTMGIATTDSDIKALAVAFNRRLRDELGVKFQLVLYNYTTANYMGVISVKNKCLDGAVGSSYPNEPNAVYFTTGIECACPINRSCQNMIYDGEYDIDVDYTQTQLSTAISNGEFAYHNVNGDVRVLDDINTLTTLSDNLSDIYKDNQTIRVIDKLANDDATVFNTRYLGNIPNNDSGRTSLWSDLLDIRKNLERVNAIDTFDSSDLTVSQGENKRSIVVENAITIINTMSKLYITTHVE